MSKHDGKVCVRLETENLILKPIEMSYKEYIFKQFSNSDVTRFMVDEEPFSKMEEAEKLINSYTVPEPRMQHRWVIIRKSDTVPIGTCGYHNWNTKDNICEIGYDLSPEYWGMGYMTEALRKIITIGFENMDLNRIQAFVHVQNSRSVDLLLRLGFKQEGIVREQFFFRGKYYDHFSFSLLKREWSL
jgi:ribosomal-protein-alanine N-acetyltransferase